MNKYPGIYRAEDGGEYIYANKDSYYCFLRGLWDESDSEDNHENDKNITAEYLTNTYGKIESKEHAEFIVKLAEANGIDVFNWYEEGDSWFNFNGGELYFWTEDFEAKSEGEKLITIPLPPKEPKAKIAADTVVAGDGKTYSVTPLSEWQGGEVKFRKVGYVEKDWPQVGDEVLINNLACNVIGIDGDAYWIKRKKTGTYDIAKREQLKKPPTPEEELANKLDEAALATIEIDDLIKLSKAIINGEIEGLEYKPQ